MSKKTAQATGEDVAKFRDRFKLTQEGFAETFGISSAAVKAYEQERRPVPRWLLISMNFWRRLRATA